MPSSAVPTDTLLDQAREFEDQYLRSRRAAIAFMEYSTTQLVEKLKQLNQYDTATKKYAVRTVKIEARTSVSGNFSAWELPGIDLCVIEGLSGLVRMETESQGELVTFGDMLDDRPIGEESAYIKAVEAVANLDDYVQRHQNAI